MGHADRHARSRCAAVAGLLAALTCAGCSSPGEMRHDASANGPSAKAMRSRSPSMTRAEVELRRGIRSYDDAEYESAARNLRSALDRGLRSSRDEANAHKYLAFVACASGRIKSCHAEFRSALEADPKFELAPAEAGHPVWGPVFRSTRLEVRGTASVR